MDDCEQHKVDWIKQSSGESLPRIIDGNKDAHFAMAATQTCVYDFTVRILTLSDTGTYYCAMDVDGEIIIGHIIQLYFADPNIMNRETLFWCLQNIISAVIIIIIIVKQN